MKEALLMEQGIVKTIIGPVDLNTGANTGGRIDMRKFKRVSFVAILGAGTTTDAHTFALKQHSVPSAGTPAPLAISNPYFHKVGNATSFTKVQPNTETDSYDLHSLLGDNASIVVFEVLQEQLSEGNRYVSLDLTDAGGAQLGTVIAIGHGATEAPAYSSAV
jgi:hypothetical protein